MSKLRVGVIFGGRSGEHEVSLMSAKSVISALDPQKYEVIPLAIDKKGKWLLPKDAAKMLDSTVAPKLSVDNPIMESEQLPLVPDPDAKTPFLDVIFPVLHGPHGEDGTVQGLLELANIAYVGAGVLGSAVSMDKAMMRSVFAQAGLPVVKWETIARKHWERDPSPIISRIEGEIGYPCFVKPANLGSSVGISKAPSREQLVEAVNLACEFDRRVVVEEALNKPREIECSVLGNDDPIVSVPGEIIPANEFYDYEAKYISEESQLIIPAEVSPEQRQLLEEYSIRAFKAVDCAGMARVDFFITEDQEVIVNEINTIPGFTKISMYPKLWEVSGIGYGELLDRLIELALERHEDRKNRRISLKP
ncbi:MAG: D-alanine--D-alanine ligase [Firmicutes bacterium]|jgi:D-alanine-D-alanine ligase|nr:D-alanine--D-alanine ligase [Bacillota bacterium]NLL87343.1 D-alanine--D-alanine ligase [Bacillota bacterium]HKM17370.1 D-alanine--D-alanine ligase [Limnochordia bacterium]